MENYQDTEHIWKFTVPQGMDANSVYATGTFIVKVQGNGARQVTDEAIMAALVNKGLVPTEVATQAGWYKEEDNFFHRVLVFRRGFERVDPSIDGVSFTMAATSPNQVHGQTVEVEVVSTSSQQKTFRIEYVPYTAKANVIFSIANDFCNVITVKRDRKRLDMFWVKTTDSLQDLPHWIVVDNLIQEEKDRKLLVTVKDRDVECFYCRQTDHWSSRCRLKKEIESAERRRIAIEKRVSRQAEANRKQYLQREIRRQDDLARRRNQTRKEKELSESQRSRQLDEHANQVIHELRNQRASMRESRPSVRVRRNSNRDSSSNDPADVSNSRSRSRPQSGSRTSRRSNCSSHHSSTHCSPNVPQHISPPSSPRGSQGKPCPTSNHSSPDSSFHCAQRERNHGDVLPSGPDSGPTYTEVDPIQEAPSEWQRDGLDNLSPKVQSQWRKDELSRSLLKTQEVQAVAEQLQLQVEQEREMSLSRRKEAGLQKQKLHNGKQQRDAAAAKALAKEKGKQDHAILLQAIEQADHERSLIKENEKGQGDNHEDGTKSDINKDDAGVPNSDVSTESNLGRRVLATNLFDIPAFKTPDDSVPTGQVGVRKRKRLRSTRSCRNQASLNETIDVVGEGSPVTVTPRKARSMSRGPTSASTPRTKQTAHIDEFYSSNPDSELSQIVSFLQQSTGTPAEKAAFHTDNSLTDKDPKKAKLKGSSDAYMWDSVNHGLVTSPAPKPYHTQEPEPNTEEDRPSEPPSLSPPKKGF